MSKITFLTFIWLLILNCMIYSQSKTNENTKIIYLSPVPSSQMNSPMTNIIIRTNNLLNKQSINTNDLTVKGSVSGLHTGTLILSDDGKTLIFNPSRKFEAGENINVKLNQGIEDVAGNPIGEYTFNFSISRYNMNTHKEIENILKKEIKKSSVSKISTLNSVESANMKKVNVDSLELPADFPQLYLSVLSNPSPGYIFMSNFDVGAFSPTGGQTTPYLMILDNSGRPFYYQKINHICLDFKLQPNGLITYYDGKVGFFYSMNQQFSIVDSFYCKNGYLTNLHELQILPNGHYLLIGDDFEKMDMSKIVAGGDTNATVMGIVIQEMDQNKNVVFQWRSMDHFKITDATDDISLTDSTVDYVHTNAIELDTDGNFLISSRNMDEITKIDRITGDIIWRLGGKNNQFQFINDDVGFSHQHDIRRLPNGDITLFDDGNLHWSKLPSRAVEYKLDEANKTAELVWQFKNIPDEQSPFMGNTQRLNNGNTIIGWGGSNPTVTEVTANGLKEFEMSLPDNVFSYRTFKFNLDSSYKNTLVPSLKFPQNNNLIPDTMITLQWSKNKFARTFHIQLAKDPSFSNIIFEDSTLKDTTVNFDSLEDGIKYYWHVLSDNNTDSIGGYAGYSNQFSFTTLLKEPENLNITTSSQATFLNWDSVTVNADSIIVERKGGSDTINYKIIAELPKSKNYFLDTSPDTINVISDQYTYRIKVINNVSESEYVYSPVITWDRVTDIYSKYTNLPGTYSLEQNYPNPFNPTTIIKYSIPKTSFVNIKVYDVLGREVATIVNEEKPAGYYEVNFNGSNLSSGIFFYKIQAGNYSSIRKMVLIK